MTSLVEPTSKPGRFGEYGGSFIPETLAPSVRALIAAYEAAKQDTAFWQEFDSLQRTFVGRETPLTSTTQ
jgi:tryptophan synthase beta chain